MTARHTWMSPQAPYASCFMHAQLLVSSIVLIVLSVKFVAVSSARPDRYIHAQRLPAARRGAAAQRKMDAVRRQEGLPLIAENAQDSAHAPLGRNIPTLKHLLLPKITIAALFFFTRHLF